MMDVLREAIITGGDPEIFDALTINGQPGDLYPCSKSGTCLVFTVKFVLLRNNLLNPDDSCACLRFFAVRFKFSVLFV